MDSDLRQIKRLVSQSFRDVPDFDVNVDVEVEALDNERSFWSEVYVAHLKPIEGSNADLGLPESVFVKLPKLTENLLRAADAIGSPVEAFYDTLVKYNDKEVAFYDVFKNAKIPHFPTLKTYYAEIKDSETTGGLVAENLTGEVYALEFLPGFDDSQVLRLMDALAGFHAHTQQMDDQSFVERFKEREPNEVFHIEMQAMMLKETADLEDYDSENFADERITKLAWSFDYDYKTQIFKKSIEAYPRVLVHTDLNVTNILWKKGSSSDDLHTIIDMQQVHEGSFAYDIVRILTLGLSAKDRQENTERYLARYHETLTTLFDGNPPYTLEQVKAEYEHIFPVASNFTLFGILVYYRMYEADILGTPETKEADKLELLSRALGIVEELERLAPAEE